MMKSFQSNSYLFGGNAPYVEELYESYLDNPGSVPEHWRNYFDNLQVVPAADGNPQTRDVAHAPIVQSFAERAKDGTLQPRVMGGDAGTARKQEGKGYAAGKYRGFFVGLAPVDNPRIIVGVMIDEPSNGVYYGGAVAAPVFSEVVGQTLRLLNVPPDADVKSPIVAKVPAGEESF